VSTPIQGTDQFLPCAPELFAGGHSKDWPKDWPKATGRDWPKIVVKLTGLEPMQCHCGGVVMPL